MKKHRVLIPLDGSEFSRRIVSHICRLLDPADHTLILLQVAEPQDKVRFGTILLDRWSQIAGRTFLRPVICDQRHDHGNVLEHR